MRDRRRWTLLLPLLFAAMILGACTQEPSPADSEPVRAMPDAGSIAAQAAAATEASEPEIPTWLIHFSGSEYGGFSDLLVLDDGLLVVGATAQGSSSDALVIKVDFTGEVIWQKTYGGEAYDQALAVREAADGGYLLLGETESYGEGKRDLYFIRIDERGREKWTKTFGGVGTEWARRMIVLRGGGVAVVGESNSFSAGDFDAFVVRLDNQGDVVWSGTFGESSANESGMAILEDESGDLFVLAGVSYSGGYAGSHRDTRLFRISPSGIERWSVLYQGDTRQYGNDMAFTQDGDLILAGLSEANSSVAGPTDFWIARVTADTGYVVWNRTEGSSFSDDYGYSLVSTPLADEFLLVGFGPQLPVFRFTDEGKTVWVRAAGADVEYGGTSIARLPSAVGGGYVIAGVMDTGAVLDRMDGFLVRIGEAGEGMHAQGINFTKPLDSN